MTIVRTDLGNTRENAARIRFEPGGSLGATNVQDAIAEVGSESFAPEPTVMDATGNIGTAFAVQTNQVAPITLTLPLAATWLAANHGYGAPLTIFDISGNAVANNVTLNFTGGETASGLAALTIDSNFGGFRFQPKSGGGWIIV